MILSTPFGNTRTELKSATVLVVEDEVFVRFCAADTLRAAGYKVLEAASADEAKVLLATFPEIALIFTDIQMPGTMDGVALARFVRAAYPGLGIVITSGAVAPPPGTDAAIEFVSKPYAPEDILNRIEHLLQ